MARFTVLDGAIGTQLRALGFPADGLTAPANLTAPDLVRRVHRQYIEAGARILTTNTFALGAAGPSDSAGPSDTADTADSANDTEALIVRGLELAQEVRATTDDGVRVALSVGPLRGAERAASFPRERVAPYLRAIERIRPDLVLIETQISTDDASALTQTIRRHSPFLPVWTGLTLRDDGRTWDDLAWPEAARRLAAAGAIPGLSCTAPTAARAALTARPETGDFWAKLNAGVPEPGGTHPVALREFLTAARHVAAAGGIAIGGCCGATPEWIAALRADPA